MTQQIRMQNLLLIEQLNQTNLDKLTRLAYKRKFLDPKAANNAFKIPQQRIKQNVVPYYPIFRTSTQLKFLTRGYTEHRNFNKSTPNGKKIRLNVINDVRFC